MKQCGFWESIIGVEMFANPPLNFQELLTFAEGVFWTESRAQEKGRSALMSFDPLKGIKEECPGFSAQSRIHEYGGGSFTVFKNGLIFATSSQGIYYKNLEGEIRSLVQDSSKRFADFTVSPDGKTVLSVCEDHSLPGDPENYLVAIDIASGHLTVLERGKPFYASCQFSPDGKKIAFLSWEFPYMPWESCTLTVANWSVEKGIEKLYTQGSLEESVCQFIWTGPGEIVFASDRSGFWNLYMWDLEKVEALWMQDADFASALWVLGRKNFSLCSFHGKRSLLCVFTKEAVDYMGIIILEGREFYPLSLPYTTIRTVDVQGVGNAYFIGGSSADPLAVVRLNLETLECVKIRESFVCSEALKSYISLPEKMISYSSCDKEAIFSFYYPPKNPMYSVTEGNKPPVIIKCHGGPTAQAYMLFSLDVQFWTSRGFGFLDVNYRGSTGFGKKYREALRNLWGILDVQDCLDAAECLVASGRVSSEGVFVKGHSSGGFTALSMAMSGGIKGCVSVYGVANLSSLMQDTHKFEKYYLDFLVGSKEQCVQRSPVTHPEKITCPVLFLHGSADVVVPLIQAESLLKELKEGELIVFPEEGHGFRFASTIQKCLEVELSFYQSKLSSSKI